MIDLHTHTTASDGRCAPAELVARARSAGITVLAVTDHDTAAGCEAAEAACERVGIRFVPGIEITAMRLGGDVHVLGYFIDRTVPALGTFLAEQRARRLERVRQIVARLALHGIELDADAILQPGLDDSSKAAGRPWVARALVQAGHVATSNEAFDRWLARGRPAFVPRSGASPEEVIRRIHAGGGIASLAHPGLSGQDAWIAELADAGLDAIEAYHSEHDPFMTASYVSLAARFSLAITGGSDYHGDEAHGATLGAVSLPAEHFDQLVRRQQAVRRTI